jgi:drug/metabolite transporter (DMT)-like permease
MVALVGAASLGAVQIESTGAVLAVTSGALASGVGYAMWYAALPGLTATAAATVQLSVPVLAALAGVLLMAEAVTPRLVIASLLILGGVALALLKRRSA